MKTHHFLPCTALLIILIVAFTITCKAQSGNPTFLNGLQKTGSDVKLGGALTGATNLLNADSSLRLTFKDSTYRLIGTARGFIGQLKQSGTGRFQVYKENSASLGDWWSFGETIDTLQKILTWHGDDHGQSKIHAVKYTTAIHYDPFPRTTTRVEFGLDVDVRYGIFNYPSIYGLFWENTKDGSMLLWKQPLSGSNADSVLVWDQVSKRVKKIARANVDGASNAWTQSGSTITNDNTGVVKIGLPLSDTVNDANLKLAVNGNIYAKKVIIKQTGWPDFVFDSTYQLTSLRNLEAFIKLNKHLPAVPSASEIEANGVDISENQAGILQTVEELMLHTMRVRQEQKRNEKKLAAHKTSLAKLKREFEIIN